MIKTYKDVISIIVKMTLKRKLLYKTEVIANVCIIAITFIFVFLLQSNDALKDYYQVDKQLSVYLFFIGFLFWQFSCLSLGYCTAMIAHDASEGLLELKVQGKISIIFLSFCELLVQLLTSLLIAFVLSIIFVFLSSINLKEVMFVGITTIMSIPGILGMFGIGLILSRFSLREKNIGSFVMIIEALLIFVTNVSSPLGNQLLGVIPFTLGIELARTLFLSGTMNYIILGTYIFVNCIWLILGIVLFSNGLRKERLIGSFDTY